MNEASIKDEWNNAAGAWVEFVRSGKDYYRDYMNNPAMFKMLGDIRGKKILDLCCGEGYNSRILAQKGALVSGVDFSDMLIEYALQEEQKKPLGINYYIKNTNDLSIFNPNSFDIVVCFMALMDIEDHVSAIRETFRVLKTDGRFVFVIPHPCFETITKSGEVPGGWKYSDNVDNKTPDNAEYYAVNKYFETGRYTIEWKMKRLNKHFVTSTFHRTFTDYTGALNQAGFKISRILEPKPTSEGMEIHPALKGHLMIPHSVVIEAVK